jgi:hypothetical protein
MLALEDSCLIGYKSGRASSFRQAGKLIEPDDVTGSGSETCKIMGEVA